MPKNPGTGPIGGITSDSIDELRTPYNNPHFVEDENDDGDGGSPGKKGRPVACQMFTCKVHRLVVTPSLTGLQCEK